MKVMPDKNPKGTYEMRSRITTRIAALACWTMFRVMSGNAAEVPQLPAPVVSKSLHAVIIPIDDSVKKTFGLKAPNDKGLFIVSVEPGGYADKAGLKAGDVIGKAAGKEVSKPHDIDRIANTLVKKKKPDDYIAYYRAGKHHSAKVVIDPGFMSYIFDVASFGRWNSWDAGLYGFGYSDWYSYNSTILTNNYNYSTTYNNETVDYNTDVDLDDNYDPDDDEDDEVEDDDEDDDDEDEDEDEDDDGDGDGDDGDDGDDGE